MQPYFWLRTLDHERKIIELTRAFKEQSRILMQFRVDGGRDEITAMDGGKSFLSTLGRTGQQLCPSRKRGQPSRRWGSGSSSRGVITIQTTVGSPSSAKGHPHSADVVHESNQVRADGNRIDTETHSKVFHDSGIWKEIEGIIAFGTRRVETLEAGSVGNERPITVVREW
jgi:hypothetical protein